MKNEQAGDYRITRDEEYGYWWIFVKDNDGCWTAIFSSKDKEKIRNMMHELAEAMIRRAEQGNA